MAQKRIISKIVDVLETKQCKNKREDLVHGVRRVGSVDAHGAGRAQSGVSMYQATTVRLVRGCPATAIRR